MTIDEVFTRFPTLTTERLRLRQIQPSDAGAFFEIFSDPTVMEFYGRDPDKSIDDTREWIQHMQAYYSRREAIRWGVTFKDEDRIIGSCSFHHFGPDYHRVETGYDLLPTQWRKGIMFEAMCAVLSFGFGDLDLHRIEAVIDMANERSKGLLLRLGFTYEGNLRQRFYSRGRFEDEYYFGLLEDEWLKTRSAS